jgi:hypothetical protein
MANDSTYAAASRWWDFVEGKSSLPVYLSHAEGKLHRLKVELLPDGHPEK